MAGHMGAVRVTNQNLEVARVLNEDGLLLIKGATPGAKGTWLEVRDAIKGTKVAELPVPGKFTDAPKVAAPKKDEPKADKKVDAPAADFIDRVVLVDGIGPKGEEVLNAAGITTLTQLVAL